MDEDFQKLKDALDLADQVNGMIIRLCCALYTMARNAGVDPDLPVMKAAEEQLKRHSFWDRERWGE
jgi:hypothetical protein